MRENIYYRISLYLLEIKWKPYDSQQTQNNRNLI